MSFRKTKQIINFGAGPAKIPEPVVARLQEGIQDFGGSGISILEISHRTQMITDMMKSTERLLRDLMGISDEYEVLFLQGGGTGQFAAVPMNLMHFAKGEKASADYLITGIWSSKAAKEAEKYLIVHKTLNPPLHHYTRIPDPSHWHHNSNSAYLYYCANETVHGVEFNFVPDSRGIPLVGDISSNVLSKPIDVSKHGVLFAGTQKNLGAAGLTITIVRKDLMGHAHKMCPSIFNFKEQHKMGSVYNTPPVFSIYLTKLVAEWIRDIGGISEISNRNVIKSNLIYDVIDDSHGFYHEIRQMTSVGTIKGHVNELKQKYTSA